MRFGTEPNEFNFLISIGSMKWRDLIGVSSIRVLILAMLSVMLLQIQIYNVGL